jgi:hypothetical protein
MPQYRKIGKMMERKRKILRRILPPLAPSPPSSTKKRKEKRKERNRENTENRKRSEGYRRLGFFFLCILICTISEPGGTQNVFAFPVLTT